MATVKAKKEDIIYIFNIMLLEIEKYVTKSVIFTRDTVGIDNVEITSDEIHVMSNSSIDGNVNNNNNKITYHY